MPIHINDRRFEKFKNAVRYVMVKHNWNKKRAAAYVAGAEKKQKGG